MKKVIVVATVAIVMMVCTSTKVEAQSNTSGWSWYRVGKSYQNPRGFLMGIIPAYGLYCFISAQINGNVTLKSFDNEGNRIIYMDAGNFKGQLRTTHANGSPMSVAEFNALIEKLPTEGNVDL
jgi:hypothetical protein